MTTQIRPATPFWFIAGCVLFAGLGLFLAFIAPTWFTAGAIGTGFVFYLAFHPVKPHPPGAMTGGPRSRVETGLVLLGLIYVVIAIIVGPRWLFFTCFGALEVGLLILLISTRRSTPQPHQNVVRAEPDEALVQNYKKRATTLIVFLMVLLPIVAGLLLHIG